MKTGKKIIMGLLVSMMISSTAFAQRTTDIDDAKDYPLVSRFEGSVIEYYKAIKWDVYPLPASLKDDKWHWDDPIKLEGKIMRWQYSVSPDNNPAYILKNFESGFKNAGYKIIMNRNGDSEDCSSHLIKYEFYEMNHDLNLQKFGFAYSPNGDQNAIIVAKTTKDGKDIYIVDVIASFSNVVLITQDVVEVEAADTGLVTAKNMADDIAATGHIAIYDIYFDTGKAEVMPASATAMKNVAEYLKANPDKHYYIVGHTDNEGDYAANMTLSENRAKAVMTYLVNDLGVDADQLKALGASSMAPVLSNTTDKGKAKNRRVEIVEQ
ncbi:MAG: hypothetical protein DRI71_05655 [Bacteroidetes bacterium]|nr:MAG: hypothetical protein DRI71_05655 [Bacteroidota bacterium]